MTRRLPLAAAACVLSLTVVAAQTRFTYSSGQTVSPAYEGWMYTPEGAYLLYFGYMPGTPCSQPWMT